MLNRRDFLKLFGLGALGTLALGSYAFAIEPLFRLKKTRYQLTPPGWTADLRLKVCVLADFHFCKPWMTVGRLRSIIDQAHALEPDIILLLGDFAAGMRTVTDYVHSSEWGPELGGLSAPLGVHAVLGNHDWWEDKTAQRNGHGPTFVHEALDKAGIPVYDNRAIRLAKDGKPFWLAGLGDQLAFLPSKARKTGWRGNDDLRGTLAQIGDDAPVILMAHEPDIFPNVPERVSLTLSGHTHGGQVNLFGWTPVVPSRYGSRFAYGHIVEDDRHLVVSGGLGCSIFPVRFGSPPEIVLIELGAPAGV